MLPTYTWELSVPPDYPPPLPALSGSGSSVGVVAKVAGAYSVTFTAKANRECPPPQIIVGTGTATAAGCSVSLSSATGKPCEVIELTLTGTCPVACGIMEYTLTPQYPPGYEMVQPWLTVATPEPKGLCTGQPHIQTVDVQIHPDAPPGLVPIVATGRTLNGSTCDATGTMTVDRTYDPISIEYRTFIAPQAIATPNLASWLWPFYAGDGRWFGGGGTSRSSQTTAITLDPGNTTGQVGTPSQGFGTTRGYDDDPEFSDVFQCEFCSPDFADYDDWCLAAGATPGCTATAVAGVGGNVLSIQPPLRVSSTQVQVQFDLVGYNPCATAVPAIDAHFSVAVRQVCDDLNVNVLKPPEFMVVGSHDGFPWHELYINGFRVYAHDPCCTQEDPTSLFDLIGNWNYETIDACHPAFQDDRPLNEWQPVPGSGP